MSNPISIIFAGTPDFAVPTLQKLIDDPRFLITLVITQPDKPVGRKQELTPPPVKVLAASKKIPIFQPKHINTEWKSFIDEHAIERPDFLVVVAFGQIISQEILDFPTIAPVNIHGSLLPKLRGASPIQHAILNNDHETGITIQRMKKELDSGPILSQKKITIDPRDTSESLFDQLKDVGAALLIDTIANPLSPVEQDHTQATFCKKLSRADGMVDPKTMTAEEVDRKVRALVPWPGVRFDDLKIIETDLQPHSDSIELSCKGGSIVYLLKVQPDGKKPMSGKEWKTGNR